MKRRPPLRHASLRDVVAEHSAKHAKLGNAADAILAAYSIPRSMALQLARSWLIEEIDRYRRPEVYAEDDGDGDL